jgi:hypothetical protein
VYRFSPPMRRASTMLGGDRSAFVAQAFEEDRTPNGTSVHHARADEEPIDARSFACDFTGGANERRGRWVPA